MEVCWELNSHPSYHHYVSLLGLLWQSSCCSSVPKSCPTPWTVTRQTPLFTVFPRQEYRSGLPFPPPGNPPDSGTKPVSPALAGGFFTTEPPRKPNKVMGCLNSFTRWYGQTRMDFLAKLIPWTWWLEMTKIYSVLEARSLKLKWFLLEALRQEPSQASLLAFLALQWSLGGFLGGSAVKNPPAMQETWVGSLGWEDPLEERIATHSSILAWRILCIEEPGGLQSVGLKRVWHSWSDWAHTHAQWSLLWITSKLLYSNLCSHHHMTFSLCCCISNLFIEGHWALDLGTTLIPSDLTF